MTKGCGLKAQSASQLQRHIKAVAKDSGRIFLTAHAKMRMKQRHVLDAEVFSCLRSGRIARQPEEDPKTGHLVCRMECYGASKNLCVCVALSDDEPDLIVVTVIA